MSTTRSTTRRIRPSKAKIKEETGVIVTPVCSRMNAEANAPIAGIAKGIDSQLWLSRDILFICALENRAILSFISIAIERLPFFQSQLGRKALSDAMPILYGDFIQLPRCHFPITQFVCNHS